jgi:hypothetical protein
LGMPAPLSRVPSEGGAQVHTVNFTGREVRAQARL